MVDAKTIKRPAPSDRGFAEFLSRHVAAIVIMDGGAKGMEYKLDQERVSLGRGPGVDLAFDDEAMSREHAAIEFQAGGYRIRDLASTNGVYVNDAHVATGELKHGDRFQLGDHVFTFVLEEVARAPMPYTIDDDDA